MDETNQTEEWNRDEIRHKSVRIYYVTIFFPSDGITWYEMIEVKREYF